MELLVWGFLKREGEIFFFFFYSFLTNTNFYMNFLPHFSTLFSKKRGGGGGEGLFIEKKWGNERLALVYHGTIVKVHQC